VMKNVAGYDVSRLMVGAMGTLGVILDVSLKTLPAPEIERSYALSMSIQEFQEQLQAMSRHLPISAALFDHGRLLVRLSGSDIAVRVAASKLNGDEIGGACWNEVNILKRFDDVKMLWRVSLAPASQLLLEESTVVDWGGGVRWVSDPTDDLRAHIAGEDGHATLMKYQAELLPVDLEVFHPLSGPVLEIHRRLKQHFDPHGIFNPGRMYREI